MAALLRDQETVATPSLPIFLALTHPAIITQLDKITPVDLSSSCSRLIYHKIIIILVTSCCRTYSDLEGYQHLPWISGDRPCPRPE